MSTRLGVAGMAALLGLYLVLVGQRALLFIGTGQPVAVAIGAALLLLPGVGVWALTRELRFGLRSQRLASLLAAEGGLPIDTLPRRASGRVVRAAADAEFEGFRAAVAAQPESWRDWFRLGLAYDASGDRRRARSAIRRAITLAASDAAAPPGQPK